MLFTRPDKLSLLIWCQRCVFPPLLIESSNKIGFSHAILSAELPERVEYNGSCCRLSIFRSNPEVQPVQNQWNIIIPHTQQLQSFTVLIIIYGIQICIMYSGVQTVEVFIMIYFSRFLSRVYEIRRLFLNCITCNIFFNYFKLQYDYYLWLTHTRMSRTMHKNYNL